MSRRWRESRHKRCRIQGCRKSTNRIVDVEGVRVRVCDAHPAPYQRAMLKPHTKPDGVL